MNERIQELIKQATVEVRSHGAFGEPERYTKLDTEKFAELIIRECMSVADLPNNASGQWDHLLPSEVIGKHFGVAE
jgi:hypothetical protein